MITIISDGSWIKPLVQMTLQELCCLPAGHVQPEWPDDLKFFVARSVEYSLEREVASEIVKATMPIDASVARGMNPKKQHEVSRLAGYLIQHCQQCDVILDIGSGLGYLGQCLTQQCGLRVLGVEWDSYRVEQGNKRHVELTNGRKMKSYSLHHTMEPSEFQSFGEMRSHLECTTETSTIVNAEKMASKPSYICDNYSNMSNMTCDCSIIPEKGANKETPVPSDCIVQLSLMDGLPLDQSLLPSDQKPCGCHTVGDDLPKHGDNNSACLLDETAACKPLKPSTKFVIEHLSLNVTKECVKRLDELVHHFLIPGVKTKVCVVGLHCCGDLTPAVLNYFVNSSLCSIHRMVLFSCCYHKMSSSSADDHMTGSEFDHFPLSSLVKAVLKAQSCNKLSFDFNVYAARLACQETRARWLSETDKDHFTHMRHVGYRSMFEAVVSTAGCSLLQRKHKTGGRKKNFECWESYVDSCLQDYQLTGLILRVITWVQFLAIGEEHSSLRSKLLEYHHYHHQYLSYIEPFTALQACLQGVLEHFVIIDRLLFLKENDLVAKSVPIFDDHVSPRSVAIVSHKT